MTAAYLAMEGFTGAPALTCEGAEGQEFWTDIGQAWRLVGHTQYKAYPCCRWAHPSLDSVHNLMRDNALTHDMIESVEIRTFHYAIRLAGHEPRSLDESTYSIAFPVAAMIVRRQISVDELSAETLHDADILRISQAIKLIDDPEMTRISTDKRWAQVSLFLKDGRRFDGAPCTPRGDADRPLTDQEISSKFHSFADPVLGTPRADEIEALSRRFDTLSVNEFTHLLALCTDPASKRNVL